MPQLCTVSRGLALLSLLLVGLVHNTDGQILFKRALCNCWEPGVSIFCQSVCYQADPPPFYPGNSGSVTNSLGAHSKRNGIEKRSWKYHACRCCYRLGSDSCCDACTFTIDPLETSSGERYSPFVKRGVSKRSYATPDDCCTDTGDDRCCAMADIYEQQGGLIQKRGYTAMMCCDLGIRGCCFNAYNDYSYGGYGVAKRGYPTVLCCQLGIQDCCFQRMGSQSWFRSGSRFGKRNFV